MIDNRMNGASRRVLVLAALAAPLVPLTAWAAQPGSDPKLEQEATEAYQRLLATNQGANALAARAKAVLIFPTITKAGFMVGGSHGKGVLRIHGQPAGYFSITSASFGLQAGVQTYSNILFFMTDNALDYLRKSNGWEIGAGPSVVVADKGFAKEGSTMELGGEVYAFIFSQKGLMAGLGLKGTKISPVK